MNYKIVSVALIVFIFLLTGLLVYVLFFPKVEIPVQVNPSQKQCPAIAVLCPDGTSVAKTGPNCETICPENKSSQTAPQAQSNPAVTPAIQKGAIYTNSDYGFKLNLPEEFEKYKSMVEIEPFEKGKSYVFIMLPTTYPNWVTENRKTHEKISGYESMFAIEVWDKSIWDKELNSKECKENPYPACPYEPDVVGKNAKYVFAVSLGNGDPTPDLEQLELKIRANNAKIIKDTFELVK